ncbi:hypothetical protein OIU74_016673 [Salix koriyanagi]|uniref:Uncharacterized protein n=1 Tax=Salix koriyanagi TaxID=2511006 RepID=A0A9Q0PGX2_9ROSI|nr:hypothetical protein OIU74_016673 [Salix koriyanagi]
MGFAAIFPTVCPPSSELVASSRALCPALVVVMPAWQDPVSVMGLVWSCLGAGSASGICDWLWGFLIWFGAGVARGSLFVPGSGCPFWVMGLLWEGCCLDLSVFGSMWLVGFVGFSAPPSTVGLGI